MWNSNSTDFSQEEHSPAYFGRHKLRSSTLLVRKQFIRVASELLRRFSFAWLSVGILVPLRPNHPHNWWCPLPDILTWKSAAASHSMVLLAAAIHLDWNMLMTQLQVWP